MIKQVKNITIEAHKALYIDNGGYEEKNGMIKKILFFDLLPFVIGVVFVILGNVLKSDSPIVDNILIVCSIFSGLLFSLIIVIVDKAKKMKEETDVNLEAKRNYLKRYLRFSRHLIVKISYAIILSILIIVGCVTLSMNILPDDWMSFIQELKPTVVSLVIYYFSIQFLFFIVDIISDMYDVFIEEIKLKK